MKILKVEKNHVARNYSRTGYWLKQKSVKAVKEFYVTEITKRTGNTFSLTQQRYFF
jgi:hypothetical protein